VAVQLGLSATDHRPLGLRHGGERRNGDRRAHARGGPDRRRGERRRARFRSLLFTALTLVLPQQLTQRALKFVPQPRVSVSIDSMVGIPPAHAYDRFIDEAAQTYRVEPALIRSVMQTESAFDPFAVSRAGAQGLMQLMPQLAEQFGVENPFDPRENIMAGARLLRELIDRHHGNLPLVLASYNAGATKVARYRAVPPFPETRNYVKRVTSLLAGARAAGAD
jgi:soluble lytic murein transglycosylase-like protein